MALRKWRCWRPKQSAPVITEMSLCSEEDLLIFRRLQEKYNCQRFHLEPFQYGKTDLKKTAANTGHTITRSMPYFERGDIEIKQEPLTPKCSLDTRLEQSVSIDSHITRLIPISEVGCHAKVLEFPDVLKMKVDENRSLVGFLKEREEGFGQVTAAQTILQVFGSEQCVTGVADMDALKEEDIDVQPDQTSAYHIKEKQSPKQRTVTSAAQLRQNRDSAVTTGSWENASDLRGLQGDTSCLSPKSKRQNQLQAVLLTEEQSLTERNALYPKHVHKTVIYDKNLPTPKHSFKSRLPGWDQTPFHKTTTSVMPSHQQLTLPCSLHDAAEPELHLFQQTENRMMATVHTTSALEATDDNATKSNAAVPLACDFGTKNVYTSPHLSTINQHHARCTASHTRQSTAPFLANKIMHADTLKTSAIREKLLKTPVSVISKKTASTLPSCMNSKNRQLTESKKHTLVETTKRSSRESIQRTLTAYANTVKRKKTTKTTETGSDIRQNKEEANNYTNRHGQQTIDSFDQDTQHGEERSPLLQSQQHVKDIRDTREDERQQIALMLDKCTMICCMVLYKDGTTNTDASLITRPEVKGLLLHCHENSYLMPVPQHCDTAAAQWSRDILNGLLRKGDTVKVAINCKHFVIALLREFSLGENRGFLDWQFEDPIIAGWLLSPDNPPRTLKALCKSVQLTVTQDGGPHNDMILCVSVMEKLRERMVHEGLWPLFCHVEMPLTPLLAVMELQAIRLNVQIFIMFSDVLKKKLEKVENKAYEVAGHSFCINSTQQLRQLLYEELKLDQQLPRKVTLTASAHHKSTSEAMLKQLVPVHPLPAVILEYRHLVKLKSTYIDGMLEAMDGGVLHTHWDQTAAATGRLASAQPNLQAVPKTPTTITDYDHNFIVGSETKSQEIYAREPFISNEGNVFLAADFQQIELRLLAHLTNDSALKDMFRSTDGSADIFIQLTAQWLSKACEDVTHAEREQTKRVVYSVLYGVGKERLAEYLKVSPSRGKDIMDSFLVSFPAIQVFTKKCVDYAQKHGYTETVMGRRRWFDRIHHKASQVRAQAERQAVNFCVQGSAADLCKRAMLRVEQALRNKTNLSARLLIHIHDELVWELPQHQLQEMCDLVKRVMEDDVLLCDPLLPCLTVPLTVSVNSGMSWAHLSPCV